METPENIDSELKGLYETEGKKIVNRLEDIRVAENVLGAYLGRGMADGMPLGEALGFLDEELKKDHPGVDKIAIEKARDFLESLIPDTYSQYMEIGEVMRNFSDEEKELAF